MNSLQESILKADNLPAREQILKDYFKSIDPKNNPVIIYIGLSKSSMFPDGTFGSTSRVCPKTGKTYGNGIDRLYKEQGQTYDAEVFVLVKEYVVPNLKFKTSNGKFINLEDYLKTFNGSSKYAEAEKQEFITIEENSIPLYLDEIDDFLNRTFGLGYPDAIGCFGLTMPYYDYIPDFISKVKFIKSVDRTNMSVNEFNEYKDSIFSDYINSNAEVGSAAVRRQVNRLNTNPDSFSEKEKEEIDRAIQGYSSSNKLNIFSKLMREIRKTVFKDQELSKSNKITTNYKGLTISSTPTGIYYPGKFILTRNNVNSRDFTKKYPGISNGQIFYVNSYLGRKDKSGKLQGETYELVVTDVVKGKVSVSTDLSTSFYVTPYIKKIWEPEIQKLFTKGSLQWIRYTFFDRDCTKSVENWLSELEVAGNYVKE